MAVNYVKGQILSSIIERDGIDIAIANANVGINTNSPTERLEVNGNVLANNIFASQTVSATGNITGGNLIIINNIDADTANIAGNITVGNLSTVGNAAAGNVLTDHLLYANGTPWDLQEPAGSNTEIQFNNNSQFGANVNFTFDTAANLLTVNATANIANVNVSGNITAGNVSTAGLISVVGNIVTDSNVVTTGSGGDIAMSGGNIVGANNISIGANISVLTGTFRNGDSGTSVINPQIEFGWANSATYQQWIHTRHYGTSSVYNSIDFYTSDGTEFGVFPTNAVLGLTVTDGKIGVNNLYPDYQLDVNGNGNITGTLYIGAKSIPNSGNIDAGTVNINNVVDPEQAQDAATKYYVDTHIGNIGNIGNLTVSNTTISSSLSNATITITPTGTGLVTIDTTTGLVIPVGNTAQRPSPGSTGTVRFNTDSGRVEVYDGTEWDTMVAGVTNQTLNGDGSTTNFTLNRSTTTAAALIMLNGITQVPDQAYSMVPSPSANLVFTEAPGTGDVIDIRFL